MHKRQRTTIFSRAPSIVHRCGLVRNPSSDTGVYPVGNGRAIVAVGKTTYMGPVSWVYIELENLFTNVPRESKNHRTRTGVGSLRYESQIGSTYCQSFEYHYRRPSHKPKRQSKSEKNRKGSSRTYRNPIISWAFKATNARRRNTSIAQRCDLLLPKNLLQMSDVLLVVVVL